MTCSDPAPSMRQNDTIQNQFARFVTIGLLSTLLDATTYHLALAVATMSLAKAAGYMAGTAFSIACNYRWTFGYGGVNGHGVIARCILLYATALILNVAVNTGAIEILGPGSLTLPVAFCFAVGVTTIYNFAGMRFWIFARRADRTGVASIPSPD